MKILKTTQLYEGEIREMEIRPTWDSPKARDGNEYNTLGGTINVYPVERQEIYGFGGAFTESAAYNFSLMDEENKQKTLEWLFGESGLGFTFCRITIGSCDFSYDEYSYVEDGDATLKTFSIEKDKRYVIPFIKAAQAYAKDKLYFFASPWAPPKFMKENGNRLLGTKLKKEYYELFAEYVAKFVEAYEREGIHISALTLQNEPSAAQTWESCFYDVEEEATYAKVLRKVLDRHGLNVKLWGWDHNKGQLFHRASVLYKEAGDVLDGMGFHWYDGAHFEEVGLTYDTWKNAGKDLILTEFCYGLSNTWDFGDYREEIMFDLKNGANAVCDWNLLLDDEGGPYHNRDAAVGENGGCGTVVFYDRKSKTAKTREIYNQTYMFAHFIQPGAKVLATSTCMECLPALAVRNPDGKMVMIVWNKSLERKTPTIKLCKDGKYSYYTFPISKNAVVTLEIED